MIKSLNHQLEMAQLKLIKSVFAVNPAHEGSGEKVSISVMLRNEGHFLDEDERQADFIQSFKTTDPARSPFFLEVEFQALFILSPAPLPLERSYYIKQVFPKTLFPYMREYVAETTRRGGFSPLIIAEKIFGADWDEPIPETSEKQKVIH